MVSKIDVTPRTASGHRRQYRLGDHQPRLAVLDQERDLRRREPEVDRDGDGPDQVGGQDRLDELGSVQHQDHHPVAVGDPAATQGSGKLGDPVAEVGPGEGVAHEAQRSRARLHEGMPFELVDPILSSRQVRLR